MTSRTSRLLAAGVTLLWLCCSSPLLAEDTQIDRDLREITIDGLHRMYMQHRYTVQQVTAWYLSRMKRYQSLYKPMLLIDSEGAMQRAREEDAEPRGSKHGALWGVPIVIKANTSVKGWTTSAGWDGFLIPGKALIAPKDALVVAHLKAAGAVLLGQTNMPDFAASDTNISSAGGRTGDAYDVRFSPGGSSGGTAMAVAGNLALLGTGTDTANSIRQPAANNSLVGFLPTRGLTSIAGIEPLDWLRDNTGPLARTVKDAAIALEVMRGEDPLDPWTKHSSDKGKNGRFTRYLQNDALRGKRFAVPWFVLEGSPSVYDTMNDAPPYHGAVVPETRAAFMHALDQLRAAGATVIIDHAILPESFFIQLRTMNTRPYRREGVEKFLHDFGPAQYHSVDEYESATGNQFPAFMLGGVRASRDAGTAEPQMLIETDPGAEKNFYGPQRTALSEYEATLKKWRLDGFVYPALQEPTYDETLPGASKSGPYSETGWVNRIGVPAISLPGGFYSNGLPFGLEISGRRWHDGELLGLGYSYEQHTHNRRPPALVTKQ